MESPHLSIINMNSLEMWFAYNVQGQPHSTHTVYVYTMQAAADNYNPNIIPNISLVALLRTMVCSGKNPMKLKK